MFWTCHHIQEKSRSYSRRIPKPSHHEWKMKNDNLLIDWMTLHQIASWSLPRVVILARKTDAAALPLTNVCCMMFRVQNFVCVLGRTVIISQDMLMLKMMTTRMRCLISKNTKPQSKNFWEATVLMPYPSKCPHRQVDFSGSLDLHLYMYLSFVVTVHVFLVFHIPEIWLPQTTLALVSVSVDGNKKQTTWHKSEFDVLMQKLVLWP